MAQTVIIIGGVALGPKAACRFKRLEPQSRVILLDKSERISYGGCGIPYFISGDVSDPDQLQSTSFNMLRDKIFSGGQRSRGLDPDPGTGHRSAGQKGPGPEVGNQEELDLSYDQLVLATGSVPRRLAAPGADLPGITHRRPGEPIRIKETISKGQVEKRSSSAPGRSGWKWPKRSRISGASKPR